MSGHGKGRRKHGAHEEEHENHERWLVTYADMITLLMVLFIVMFAMSQVDQRKFNALKEGLAAGFGQSTSILDGSTSILEEPGTSAVEPITPPKDMHDLAEIDEVKFAAGYEKLKQAELQRKYAEVEVEADRLADIEGRLRNALRRQGLLGDVRTKLDGRGLTISLVSKHVVFENDVATLTPRGERLVMALAPVLRSIDDELSIEGHTNQVKVKPKYYPTDWHLSSARAMTVLLLLTDRGGIPLRRVAATAYGHTQPLVDPALPQSQELNKRVDIVVLAGLNQESAQMLEQVTRQRAAELADRATDAVTAAVRDVGSRAQAAAHEPAPEAAAHEPAHEAAAHEPAPHADGTGTDHPEEH